MARRGSAARNCPPAGWRWRSARWWLWEAGVASAARPGAALEAGPERGPVPGGGLGDDQGDAAGVEEDAAADAQDALTEAAQAPARPGGDLHQASPGMHQLVGHEVQQQQRLVAGDHIEAGGQRWQWAAAVVTLRTLRRGQRRRQNVHQLAEVALGGAALAVMGEQFPGRHGGGADAGE